MRLGKVLCAVGAHRWRQVRLITKISPMDTAGPELRFRVDDSEFVTECARCRRRRRS